MPVQATASTKQAVSSGARSTASAASERPALEEPTPYAVYSSVDCNAQLLLNGGATSTQVPDGFARTGFTYVVDVKALSRGGRLTVTDARFTTQ